MNNQVKLSAGVSAILQDLMDTKVQLMLARDALAAMQTRVDELEAARAGIANEAGYQPVE